MPSRILLGMNRTALSLVVLSLLTLTTHASDWPWWRGPNRDGIADPKQSPPLTWSEKENVVWKSPIPGRGHSSPIVVGEQVFLATAEPDRQVQSVLCYDRKTGKKLWQTDCHQGTFEKKGNPKSTLASSTVACDGERLFINFLHEGAIHATCLDRAGKILWQKKVCDYKIHQGFAASPAIYQDLVIFAGDSAAGGVIAAYKRATGELAWSVDRPKAHNYASPIIHSVAGKDQLFLIGCDLVTSLEPATGKKNWEIKGSTTECVTSTVVVGDLMVTSGGFPKSHVAAVKADGSGKTVWESKSRIYVPSLLAHNGYFFGVLDAGVPICWKGDTGDEVWKARTEGIYSASPVLVGDLIFATTEAGVTYIWKANPKAFELIGQNNLGDEAFATPTFVDGRIYYRAAHKSAAGRQEFLYCLGK